MRNMTSPDEMRSNIRLVPRAIYTLSGVVSELTPSGLAPLEGAFVNEGCKDQISRTDKNGFYSISQLYPFAFFPGFSKEGYQSESRIVTINGDTRLDIQLVRC